MRMQGIIYILIAWATFTCTHADVWVEVEELLIKLDNDVQAAIRTSWGSIGVLQREIIDAARNVSDEARVQVEESAAKIKSQLDNLEILAGAYGAQHCVGGYQEQLIFVRNMIEDDIMQCINQETGLAVGIMSNASISISDAQRTVYNLKTRLEDCKQNDDGLCIVLIRIHVLLAIDEVPTQVVDTMLEILRLTVGSKQLIHDCADHRIGLIYVEGNRMVFDLENCIINSGPERRS